MKDPEDPHDARHLERTVRALLGRKRPLWSDADAASVLRAVRSQPTAENADPPARWQDPIIEEAISDGASVLDLGCGDGDLLQRLIRDKQVRAQGVEFDADAVRTCIERGVPVLQCDMDAGLRGFADHSFDTVVLEETLQTLHRPLHVLGEMLRVGRRGIVSFPNFGAWRIRLALAIEGRMPVTERLPYRWHDTPNIHLFTMRDFLDWVQASGVTVSSAYVLRGHEVAPLQPGDALDADEALFFLAR